MHPPTKATILLYALRVTTLPTTELTARDATLIIEYPIDYMSNILFPYTPYVKESA
ncbi:MAG: hypothetical protein ABW157_09870 [Candidatus Thiodiazotropha sp. LLP2]